MRFDSIVSLQLEEADTVLKHISTIKKEIDQIDQICLRSMTEEDAAKITTALANAYGVILAELELPIKLKYPSAS